ncbi:hypothetical protein MN608_04064 [Microdochium nivale]|nr:hypothetical protein MN608_04064 [Microdochium nivale]
MCRPPLIKLQTSCSHEYISFTAASVTSTPAFKTFLHSISMDYPPTMNIAEDDDDFGGKISAPLEKRLGDPTPRTAEVILKPRINASLVRDPLSPLNCPLLMGWMSFLNLWCASTAYRRSESWESSSTSDKVLMSGGVVGILNMTWLLVALLHRAATGGHVE